MFRNRHDNHDKVDQALNQLKIPSWKQIRQELEQQQTPEERSFRSEIKAGTTPSPLNHIRRFSSDNKKPRVTFFRDSASWCPYCHKVWMSLEEKGIDYAVEKVNMSCYGDKPISFLIMQPSGQIPVAKIDDKVYRQSNDIIYALEELFPDKQSLLPQDCIDEVHELLRLERKLFSVWLSWLTGNSQWKGEFVETLAVVDKTLARNGGPYFLGDTISTVDIQFAPFLERMAASLLYFKAFQIRVPRGQVTDYPNINNWFDAMETRPSYQLSKSDIYTHAWDLPPQLGGCVSEAGTEQVQAKINDWRLPLESHQGGLEPDWTWCGDVSAHQREAVERLTWNHEAIVKFACRGAGSEGIPHVSAPLADPNASPKDSVVGSVDAVLRLVSLVLLEGNTAERQEDLREVAHVIVTEGDAVLASLVSDSVAYLRDRVGVPRDMRLPAARQLRSHLNWVIDEISAVS